MTEALHDTGERMLPASEGEVSIIFARHKLAYEYAAEYVSGHTVLDAGCGTGYGAHMLSSRAQRVYAIDRSGEALDFCRSHYAAANLDFIPMDVTRLAFDRIMDVAVSYQVIEHLPDPKGFLAGLKSVVKPGGVILLTTPNVRTPRTGADANPFHCSEMNCAQFHALLGTQFRSFEILGIGHARPNLLRTLVIRSPLYRLGKLIRRKSFVKKIANRTLDLTSFHIIKEHVAEDALDLLAVCRVED